jgi:Na+/H+ antiporter NhaD/arsenite permease-like protein
MMLIINLIRPTGIFEYITIKSAKISQSDPLRIMIMVMLAAVTAVFSAFLDNVTPVLLIASITLLIADDLDVDPSPYIIVEALAYNISSTATLIGDSCSTRPRSCW